MMEKEFFDMKIKAPFNEAWACLQPVRDNNSDEAWNEYMNRLDCFHKRLSREKKPHEFEFLRLLYRAVMEAADVIGDSYKK